MKPYKGGVRHDYKEPLLAPSAPRRERRWSLFVLGLALPLITVSLLLTSQRNESKLPDPVPSGLEEIPLDRLPLGVLNEKPPAVAEAFARSSSSLLPLPAGLRAPARPGASGAFAAAAGTTLELVVQRGDSLERLFRRNDLSLNDLAAMVGLDEAADHLKLLKPGDRIQVTHRDGNVLSLQREIDRIRMLSVARSDSGFKAETLERPVEVREITAHGRIRTSLFEAGAAAGISDSLTMSMAGIFQWDIDFIQDVRIGDRFTLIYEEHWRDGEKLGNGPVIAAEFVNRGETYRAARYTNEAGRTDYYTPEGRSVRKAFLRAPVDFTRISSNFDPNRRHPVLNTIRAHRGVDYAAPTGTPVRAAGDGKVVSRGRNGGYGNAVVLKHGGNITTLYAHLSRFGGHGVGSRIEQGDVIGYVGQSGLATGPHLHYEYRVNGVHRNPRTVSLPPADPVPEQYRADFEATTATLWERLEEATRMPLTTVATR